MYVRNNNVVNTITHTQLLDVDPQDQAEEDGGHMDLDSQRKGKCAVIKTSTRQVLNIHPPPHTHGERITFNDPPSPARHTSSQ